MTMDTVTPCAYLPMSERAALGGGRSIRVEIDAWVGWMQLVGMSPETVRRRKVTLWSLERFVAPALLPAVTGELVEEWLRRWNSPATRHAYLSDVRQFYRWAVKRHLVAFDPTEQIGTVKVPATLPRPLDESSLADLLAGCGDQRVKLAIMLAAMAGLRRAEVCALCWQDIDLDAHPGVLTIRNGKGGKDRAVPVHPVLGAALGVAAQRSGPVVVANHGGHLSPEHLGRLVRMAMAEAGLSGAIHRARHRFGTMAARASGGDVIAVAALMGHASPQTTAGYIQLAGGRSAEVIQAMPGV